MCDSLQSLSISRIFSTLGHLQHGDNMPKFLVARAFKKCLQFTHGLFIS